MFDHSFVYQHKMITAEILCLPALGDRDCFVICMKESYELQKILLHWWTEFSVEFWCDLMTF